MQNKITKIVAIIYTTLSILSLPFLLFLQMFSVFLFDASDAVESGAVSIALCILLIPITLIYANIAMWRSVRAQQVSHAWLWIAMPFAFTGLFFLLWSLEFINVIHLLLLATIVGLCLPLFKKQVMGLYYTLRK